MTEEYPYLVIYRTNGEKGWSGPYEYYELFETLEEAEKYYKRIEMGDCDWDCTSKRLFEVKTIKEDYE